MRPLSVTTDGLDTSFDVDRAGLFSPVPSDVGSSVSKIGTASAIGDIREQLDNMGMSFNCPLLPPRIE